MAVLSPAIFSFLRKAIAIFLFLFSGMAILFLGIVGVVFFDVNLLWIGRPIAWAYGMSGIVIGIYLWWNVAKPYMLLAGWTAVTLFLFWAMRCCG